MLRSIVRQFHSSGVSTPLIDSLKHNKIVKPTSIQEKAIPAIIQGNDVIIGSETGSGKTLAYLLPLLSRIQQTVGSDSEALASLRSPKAVIIVPNRELANQVSNVIEVLDSKIHEKTAIVASNSYFFPRGTAVLIATPRSFIKENKVKRFTTTESIVFDEADMLLNGGFKHDCQTIMTKLKRLPYGGEDEFHNKDVVNPATDNKKRQFIFCAATFPEAGRKSIGGWIKKLYPNATYAQSETFHRFPKGLEVENRTLKVDQSAQGTEDQFEAKGFEELEEEARNKLLLQVLDENQSEDHDESSATMVFVNSVERAKKVFEFLKENRTAVEVLHKETNSFDREIVLEKLRSGNTNFLVCTDVAARGLDTTMVKHVVQYDFARDLVSYLHRAGRTARAGTTGKVTNLIGNADKLLFDKIQSGEDGAVDQAFSRRRGLRKKFRKQQREMKSEDGQGQNQS